MMMLSFHGGELTNFDFGSAVEQFVKINLGANKIIKKISHEHLIHMMFCKLCLFYVFKQKTVKLY